MSAKFSLEQFLKWAETLSDRGIAGTEIEISSTENDNGAWVNFFSGNTYGHIMVWPTGEIEYLVEDATDPDCRLFRYEETIELSEVPDFAQPILQIFCRPA